MNQERWDAVDEYIKEVVVRPDAALDAAMEASAAAGLPPISVSPSHGKFLFVLARTVGAKSILEIGTLGGYSTIWMARGLVAGGRVVTLEADAKHAEVACANFVRAGVSDAIELRLGKALDSLPQVATDGRGPFDLIFIDADKANIPEYFRWGLKLSRVGSLIIVDNVVRDGEVIHAASSDPNIQGVRRFNEMLASEPRVSATEIQTVGSKGYDGFAIAVVNA
jgi:predicted O-methyltransferase YrrM